MRMQLEEILVRLHRLGHERLVGRVEQVRDESGMLAHDQGPEFRGAPGIQAGVARRQAGKALDEVVAFTGRVVEERGPDQDLEQIGSASSRERVCQYE